MKVSVIIPVYNTEKYIAKCLDSLINQTLKDIEIICVDNGSTDKSYEILKKYEKENANIKVFQKLEGRQGAARNVGLNIAQGDYVGFVDSDDFVKAEMFEKMYQAISMNNADMCVCNINLYFQGNSEIHKHLPEEWFDKDYFDIKQVPIFFRNLTICNKLFSRRFLVENNISFPEDYFHEDQFFVVQSYTLATTITCLPDAFYFYRKQRDGSVSSSSNKGAFDIFPVMQKIREFTEHLEDSIDWKEIIAQVAVSRYLQLFNTLSNDSKKNFFKIMKYDFVISPEISKLDILSLQEFIQYRIVRRFSYPLALLISNLYFFYSRAKKAICRGMGI